MISKLGDLARELPPRSRVVLIGAALVVTSASVALSYQLPAAVAILIAISCAAIGVVVVVFGFVSSDLKQSRISSPDRLEQNLEHAKPFADYGLVGIWDPRTGEEFKKKLAGARKLRILKTWFPEDEDIAVGLTDALRDNGATIKLILCHPKSKALQIRSEGAGLVNPATASEWIIDGLQIVANSTAEDRFEGVALHHVWPGCPIIWADDKMYLGFYFHGTSSPNSPWIEIEPKSIFGRKLKAQFDLLEQRTGKPRTRVFTELDRLKRWLKSCKSRGRK